MTIGERIKALREERNISQETMSFEINVSRQTISKWENDSVLPDSNNISVLCKYFEGDINIERLAEATEIPENIKQNLAPLQNQINALNVEVSADKDYAIIDGEQYKRVKND